MATLYLMRHGETLFNTMDLKQGWCDSPLTERGREQARGAGAWMRAHGLAFDHVYASTSERVCDTVELALPGVPYERVKGLKEWNYGAYEGISQRLDPPPMKGDLRYGDYYKQFGGEGEVEFRARIANTLLQIMDRPGHECVLAACHGGFMAQYLRVLGYEPLDILPGRKLGNCCIMRFEFDAGSKAFHFQEIINPLD